MKNVLVYSRVSTDEQAKTGYSLPDQEAKLKAFCMLKNLNVVGTYREDFSAKTFDRPQWKKILEFIRANKGKVDTILFSRWDRFSRNAEESYGMFVTLRKLGVEVQAFEQPLDLSIPENKFMLAFYLTQPEVDNDRRAMNILSGIRRARMEGRWTQQAPMGYKNTRDEHNKPIIVPSKDAMHIVYTFKETAKGVKNQEEIRQELLKKGFQCSKNNFYKLIRNKAYIGLVRVKADKNEPEYFVKGIHEPLLLQRCSIRRSTCWMSVIATAINARVSASVMTCYCAGSSIVHTATRKSLGANQKVPHSPISTTIAITVISSALKLL